jgi:hypothetical protein
MQEDRLSLNPVCKLSAKSGKSKRDDGAESKERRATQQGETIQQVAGHKHQPRTQGRG